MLKHKNAFLIYASDHAESLGEEGRRSHGLDHAKEQREIPVMIWVSDQFKQNHPEYVKSISDYKEKGGTISHDYIFHTILGCLSIESEIRKDDLNLCHH